MACAGPASVLGAWVCRTDLQAISHHNFLTLKTNHFYTPGTHFGLCSLNSQSVAPLCQFPISPLSFIQGRETEFCVHPQTSITWNVLFWLRKEETLLPVQRRCTSFEDHEEQDYSCSQRLGSVHKLLDLDDKTEVGLPGVDILSGNFSESLWQSEQKKQNSPCWFSPTPLLLQQTFGAKHQALWFHPCDRRKQRQLIILCG